MEKQWIKGSNYKEYAFWVDGKKIGDMNIKFSQISHRAICTIGEKEFEIKRVGYWKSNFGMYFGITHNICELRVKTQSKVGQRQPI